MGLTASNTKVYLTLIKFGPSELSKLAELAKIARPDVYRKLSKLQKMGLIEKILERPARYSAIPINEALSLLLQAKTEEYMEIKKETQILIESSKTAEVNKGNPIENPQFVLIPAGKRLTSKIKTAIENTHFCICNVLSWKRFSQGILNRFGENLERAAARNVASRFIVEKPPRNKTSEDMVRFCREKLGSKIKFIPNKPRTIFAIYDQKQIVITARAETDFQSSPALWSNSSALVALGLDHFEELWKQAKQQLD